MTTKVAFGSDPLGAPRARTLAIAVGGTTLKASVLDARGKMVADRVSVPTPYPRPPKVLIHTLAKLVRPLPAYDRVALGLPGYVRGNKVITAPHYGTKHWHGFNLAGALQAQLGRPVRLLNDADMQGLAAIKGKGLELVVTFGTGVGTALFRDGELMPHLELAQHPGHKGKDHNACLGNKALHHAGTRKWHRRTQRVLKILHARVQFDLVYLGGGNARKISFKPDARVRLISNDDGIGGGYPLWGPHRLAERHQGGSGRPPVALAPRARRKPARAKPATR